MAKVLFFNTKNEAVLVNCKVQDGKIVYQDKIFVVDKAYPLLIKTSFGYEPLYIIKWDSLEPSYNLNPPVGILKKLKNNQLQLAENYTIVDTQWRDWIKEGLNPDMMRRLVGLQILGNMIKVKRRAEVGPFVTIILGLILGISIFYSLAYFKIIKF